MPGAIDARPLPVRKHPGGFIVDEHISPISAAKKPLDKFPVTAPADFVTKHNGPTDGEEPHLRIDIANIGEQLNNVNNELYHVLNELLNRQSSGFDNTLYNLRAKDYNAALPDRRLYIKPLLNPTTGIEHGKFFRTQKVKEEGSADEVDIVVPVTIEALEALSNIDKEAILTDLGMEQGFNLLHNMMSGPKGPRGDRITAEKDAADKAKADKAKFDNLPEEKRDEKQAEIDKAKNAEKEFTSEPGLAQYLFDLDGQEKKETEEMYAAYLTTQLRVAVGLTRNYCP